MKPKEFILPDFPTLPGLSFITLKAVVLSWMAIPETYPIDKDPLGSKIERKLTIRDKDEYVNLLTVYEATNWDELEDALNECLESDQQVALLGTILKNMTNV